jgi:hypothetical protein
MWNTLYLYIWTIYLFQSWGADSSEDTGVHLLGCVGIYQQIAAQKMNINNLSNDFCRMTFSHKIMYLHCYIKWSLNCPV